jgi:RND family efflux transporter MFP subunit
MSGSMFLGRVLLPGISLALAGILAVQTVGTGTLEVRLPATLTSLTDRAGPAPGQPASTSIAARKPDGPRGIVAEGRVLAYPGAEVVVGAELAGVITRVLVQEKSVVHKGDLLVEFRADEIRAGAEEAVARVAEIDAEIARIELEQSRVNRLPDKQPGVDQARDRVKAHGNAARARRTAAAAVYRRIQAEFARTRIRAPIDGVVIAREVNPGETVSLGTPLVKIVDLNRLRIEAEVDEFDIPRCAQGSGVTITAEGYAETSWRGSVEDIADRVIPRRMRPEDPGRPSDTRILPVRIALHEPTPLKLGQRVEVEIAEGARTPMSSDRPADLTSAKPVSRSSR